MDSDGRVYETTTEGGANGLGTLFSCDIDIGVGIKEFDFTTQSGYGAFHTQITQL